MRTLPIITLITKITTNNTMYSVQKFHSFNKILKVSL